MLLHYKNLGIVLCIVRRACDMLNSADLQDQQNRRFSHWEPFSNYFLIRMLACRSLICHASARSAEQRFQPGVHPSPRPLSRTRRLAHAVVLCAASQAANQLALAGEVDS